jgi:hypothetical protein
VGWKPGLDLPFGQGDRYLTSATKECLEIIRKRSGQTFDNTNAASVALAVCDGVFGVAEAFKRAGPVRNVSTAVRGFESLGGSFRTGPPSEGVHRPRSARRAGAGLRHVLGQRLQVHQVPRQRSPHPGRLTPRTVRRLCLR